MLSMALLLTTGVKPVHAGASSLCYTLTNFCDRIEVIKDGFKGWTGYWDATCTNTRTVIAGKKSTALLGDAHDSNGQDSIFRFNFNKFTSTFDLFLTDGTITSQIQSFQPYSVTA